MYYTLQEGRANVSFTKDRGAVEGDSDTEKSEVAVFGRDQGLIVGDTVVEIGSLVSMEMTEFKEGQNYHN